MLSVKHERMLERILDALDPEPKKEEKEKKERKLNDDRKRDEKGRFTAEFSELGEEFEFICDDRNWKCIKTSETTWELVPRLTFGDVALLAGTILVVGITIIWIM